MKATCAITCWGTLCALACMVVGCDQAKDAKANPSATASVQLPTAAVRSPAEMATLLHQYHLDRDYGRLAPLIAPQQREATMGFLKAMDEVLDASRSLREVAVKHFGQRMPQVLDLSRLEDNLGVFSRKFNLINQRFRGDTAVVTLQEDENVPLVRLDFKRGDEGWQCLPAPTPEGTLSHLSNLAEALTEVERAISGGRSIPESLRVYYDRVLPQLMGLARLGMREDDRI